MNTPTEREQQFRRESRRTSTGDYFHSMDRHCYLWTGDSGHGPIPTLHWEAVREGHKDSLYLATLESLIAGKNTPATESAAAFLKEIDSKIMLKSAAYDRIAGGTVPAEPPGTYERRRKQLVRFIERLSK